MKDAADLARTSYLASFAEGPGYLDFARVGPMSRRVIGARNAAAEALLTPGPATVDTLMQAGPAGVRAAAAVAGLPAAAIAYVPNTSTGLFQVAFALTAAGPRTEILIGADEFPSNTYPWARAHAAGRLEPAWLRTGGVGVTPELLAERITERTAAVSVSAVDFRSGRTIDLAAVRSILGNRLLIVDAIQAFGAVAMDWSLADAVIVGGQKWLRSGWGTGFVAVSDRLADRWDPLLAGWTAVERVVEYDGRLHPTVPGAGSLSITNLSPIDQAAFLAGLELVQSVGVPWIQARIADIAGRLAGRLRDIGAVVAAGRPDAGIVPFRLPDAPMEKVHRTLTAAGIACTWHADRIRLSVHATTTVESIDLVCAAVEDARRLLRRGDRPEPDVGRPPEVPVDAAAGPTSRPARRAVSAAVSDNES